jgi:hypothetical protein
MDELRDEWMNGFAGFTREHPERIDIVVAKPTPDPAPDILWGTSEKRKLLILW